MERRDKIVLGIFFAVLLFLLLFRLGRGDMLSDDGHYAFRAAGYFDFMASKEQTTPVQWFGHRPGWSFFSFHDHPFFGFFVQFIFIKLLGASVFVSRLPSVLASLASFFATYFLAREIAGKKTAYLAILALVLNSYFIWTGRIGLLESLFLSLLLWGLLFLQKGLRDEKNFVWAGLFLGLSFLTKYTFLIALPGILVFLLINRRIFFKAKFWKGVAVFAVAALPIVIYNSAMYFSRGHFDVQFSFLFRQGFADWPILGSRYQSASFSPMNFFSILIDGFSAPYFWAFAISFIVMLVLFILRRLDRSKVLALLIFVSLFLGFSIIGPAPRWLGVTSAFAAIIIAQAAGTVLSMTQKLWQKALIFAPLIVVLGFSAFYLINTNHLIKPVGTLYASFRVPGLGYNQLDKKIAEIINGEYSPRDIRQAVQTWWYKSFTPPLVRKVDPALHTPFRSLIVYDSNTNWFASSWIFERRKIYDGYLIMTAEEFLQVSRSERDVAFLNSLDLDGVYFVKSGDAVAAESQANFAETDLLLKGFAGIEPSIVRDPQGREAFYIYHGQFK